MKLKITGTRDAGNLTKERLVLRALADADVGAFAIFAAQTDGAVVHAGKLNAAFWFPDKQIKAGDLVVLYTKRGTLGEKRNETGSTSHFFYWNLDHACWESGHVPVLTEVGTWTAHLARASTAA